MVRVFLSLLIAFSSPSLFAQEAGSDDNPTVIEKYGPRRQISTIVYMGLAGAVLGLSTLSFYGRPQDKLTNIPIGFGIGVVVGTVYMTYQAAANPDEFYRESQLDYQPTFDQMKTEDLTVADLLIRNESPSFSYHWDF